MALAIRTLNCLVPRPLFCYARGVEMSKAALQAKEKILQDEIEKYRDLQKGGYAAIKYMCVSTNVTLPSKR